MTSKKWLISFLLTVIGIALLIAGFNVLTDPFGVFGDPICFQGPDKLPCCGAII